MDGILLPENRGRQRGSRNKHTDVRDAAVNEALNLATGGMSKIAAAKHVKAKYELGAQAEYIARLIGQAAKQRRNF
jgi:hypothetical protein